MVVLHGKAGCTGYFTGKVLLYQSIRENGETFLPWTICNVQYIIKYDSTYSMFNTVYMVYLAVALIWRFGESRPKSLN